MTSILNADPYPWGDADAVRLHKALTETFFEVADAENIAAAATLNTRKLYTRQGPDPFWRDVLNAAAANGLTHKLAEVATSRLPATAPLHALLARLLAEAPPVDTATRLHRVRSDVRLRLNGILDHNRVVGGRTRELATLDAFLADPTPQHLVLTGQAGMGKTALLVEWVRRLDARSDVDEICYFISRQHGTAKYSDLLRTLLIQAVAVREGEPPLPGSADDELERAWLQELQPSWSGLRPRPIVVVIDGVDEAEARGWSVPQLLLPTRLAADVHMVVSARTMGDRDWPYELGLTGAKLLPVGGLDEADVADLLAVAGVPAWVREPDALSTLMERTDGDPFYLRFLVDALTGRARKKITSPTALRNVPDGLTSYLKELWDDAGGSAGNTARLTTLGYLCEAKGPITMKELAEIDPDDGLKVHVIRGVLDQIGDRVVVVDPTSEGITLAHWRLQEIVAADLMSDRDRVACRDALLAWCRRWAQHRHPYAVKYVAAHRIESATGPDDLAAATDLLADAEYQKLRVEELDDAAGLFGDLDRLLRAVTDDATSPAATLVRAALAVGDARTDWSRPERVFELVDEGKADDAVRRLALLGSPAWQPWQQGGSLVLAWALAEAHPDTARDLLNAAARLPGGHPLQDLLAGRVRHALRDGPEPELRLWFPPFALPPSDRGQAVAALERASGQPVNPYNLSGLRDPRSYTSSNESGAYLAEDEAPWLVAYARDEPGEGEAWLKSYLALQAGNPYALYRNWALWSVLAAVCCLPDPAQALPYAVLVTQAAFAPSAVRFSEFAHLAAVAGTGDTATVTAARSAAMRDAAAVAGLGELGDQWGHHVRRLAAHAEVAAIVLGDRAAAAPLLGDAMAVPLGYAGFRAPAQLAMAEIFAILGDPAGRRAALDQALRSAHNVQEPAFCALTTARVATLTAWWNDPLPPLPALVDDFVGHPDAPRFGPRHRLGEPFLHRDRDDHLPIDAVTNALDARDLAVALDMAEGRLLDPGPGTDGATIVLPDPEFPPLVAAHLSARIAAVGLSHPDRVRLTAALVPVAVADATALDLVLGRWICALASGGADLAALLDPLSQRSTVEPAGGGEAGVA